MATKAKPQPTAKSKPGANGANGAKVKGANGKAANGANGKAAKAAAAASVIQGVSTPEDEGNDVLMNRQLPAFALSGAVHVVLILFLILLRPGGEVDTGPGPVDINLPEPPADPTDDSPDQGLDADSDELLAIDSDRVEDLNVDAEVNLKEEVGVPDNPNTDPQDYLNQATDPTTQDLTGGAEFMPGGMLQMGTGGTGGVPNAAPGMNGRSGATRSALVSRGGGNGKSERAVQLGLAWLAKQQKLDGGWVYDSKDGPTHRISATGMALLPFLAAGHTPRTGRYKSTVNRGVTFLLANFLPNGTFKGINKSHHMYEHGIAALALCEAYGMTKDKRLKGPAQQAVNFIVVHQIKGGEHKGAWGYKPVSEKGDTSIVGWQVQALKSGKLSGLRVPDSALDLSAKFLDHVGSGGGTQYGYQNKGTSRSSLDAVGLLCRHYLGWGPRHATLVKGAKRLADKYAPKKNDRQFPLYMYYYATQVVHFVGGTAWSEQWNPKMRDMLIKRQTMDPPALRGSWPTGGSRWMGGKTGRIGTTCLCLLTLEVYYRYLPTYQRDQGGARELEQ